MILFSIVIAIVVDIDYHFVDNKHKNKNSLIVKAGLCMAITPEVQTVIETMMNAIGRKEIQKPGMAMNTFTDNFSALLAQMDNDIENLVAAGFKRDNTVLYRSFFEYLLITHGERRGVLEVTPEKKQYFNSEFTKAETDKKRLLVVGRHVAETSGFHSDWKAENSPCGGKPAERSLKP